MKKKIFIIMCFFIVPFLFGDEITDLLDKAKVQYANNDREALIKTIDTIKDKLKNEETKKPSSEAVEVSFNRLKLTPEKYENKALKLKGVAISSSSFMKLENYNKKNEYGVLLSNVAQNDYFSAYLQDGDICFVMDDTFVDKLLDIIPTGYSYYYNIWTEPVYAYSYYLTSYSTTKRICYIAKIIKLEAIEYNKMTGQIFDTGEFIEN